MEKFAAMLFSGIAFLFLTSCGPAQPRQDLDQPDPDLPQVDQPDLGCRDPAITALGDTDAAPDSLRVVSVTVTNIGGRDFVSAKGQQQVQLYKDDVLVTSDTFPGYRLDAGASFTITYRETAPPTGAREAWTALIVYGPDILTDSNLQNDDCENENNRKDWVVE